MTLEREEGPRPHSTLLAGIFVPHYSLLEAQDPGALAISQMFHHQRARRRHLNIRWWQGDSLMLWVVCSKLFRSPNPLTSCSRHVCIMGHGEGAEFSDRTSPDQELTRKARSRCGALAWFRHQGSSRTQSTVLTNCLTWGGGVCNRRRRDIRQLCTNAAKRISSDTAIVYVCTSGPRLLFWSRYRARGLCQTLHLPCENIASADTTTPTSDYSALLAFGNQSLIPSINRPREVTNGGPFTV
ncbi:hypothetical protein LY78DRAFT_227266 [Colletotrichum sublineola]|nr:hypothetical protein LY78DRAFT_227266 [Colletotrichum sublineola]